MKISIIGYSGSGKSTLAKKLGEIYNCKVLYLDTVNFEPNWKERNVEECKAIVKEFMKNKSWVIDGNYTKFEKKERLEEADLIIFMDFNRRICFRQAYKRYLENRNRTRESMTEGCEEKFDFEFMKWLIKDGRSKKKKEDYKRICSEYKEKVIICKNRKEVEEKVINKINKI